MLIPQIEGGYGCIVADPPWRFDNTASRAASENHYQTLSIYEIAAISVAGVAAKNAHLYLWVTDAHLEDVFKIDLMGAWGFRYVQTLKWLKIKDGQPQMGMGNYFRHATELCLFGVRGRASARVHDQLDFFWSPRLDHSQKPEALQDLAEQVSPGPYLELFARRRRPNWFCIGDQL